MATPKKPRASEVAEQAFEQISGQNTLRLRRDFNMVSRRYIVNGSANLTLSENISGALVRMNAAAQAYVLPAATDALQGVFWEFQTTVAATTVTITALAGDLYSGGVINQSDTATAGDYFSPDGSDDVVITLNGGTTGGALGSRLTITCGGLDLWLVTGVLHGVGATMATPFS